MEVWEKSETVDPEVRAYVHSLVNAVGGQSNLDDRYAIGDDALAVLNDLLRWIRLYDDKTNRYDVKRCLAEANLLKGDLLEILALWPEEAQDNKWKAKLALACMQLMTTLTWPMQVEEEKTTRNHVRHMPYLQLAQVGYKRAILHYEDARILRTVVRVGLPAMAEPRRERSRRHEGIIKLVLSFCRNLVMITQPQELPSQGDENEISRSATIEAFHEQDVFNLFLTIGSGANDEFQEHDVPVLETLFHLLKGIDPRKLFLEEKQLASKEVDELQSLIWKEKAMHNSYNKHAPTRHNRFGTMLWVKRDDAKMSTITGQNVITDASNTLIQMDASKKYDKPKYRGKRTVESKETNADFSMRVDLTEKARKYLRSFVEDFLDSSFNPLFSSLRKAIEREMERVVPSNFRQFWYLISWFLTAEAARREQRQKLQSAPEDNTFAYIAAVLDQETFVLLNRHMQRSFDEKVYHDLQATLLCFTQILLTVQKMSESQDEEDQEIAENIQNRIFYEETTHDRIVAICKGYKHQAFSYLDAVTECVHVFVRMLERYSKQNVDLQIRSKRRARKKKKPDPQPSTDAEHNDTAPAAPEDDNEDEQEAHLTARERKFDFSRFSAKFFSQGCVDTFLALLHFYADLTPAQLKRCHRFFYRLAFKNELFVLLFRVDILLLLQRMVKGPHGLDPAVEGFKEWEVLVQQLFRRCIKWLERESEGEGWKEAAVVEMLFSKIPNTLFYLQNGFDRVVEKRAPRAPAELEIKASVPREDLGKRVGIVVSVMLEQGKLDAIDWVKGQLEKAGDERQAWEDERAALTVEENPSLDQGSTPVIFVSPDSDERKSEMFKDKYLRLLLTTVGLQRLGLPEDTDASWIIPSELSAQDLKESLGRIEVAEFDQPVFDDGKGALDFIRNKSSARPTTDGEDTAAGAAAFDSAESSDDGDAPLFPANLPSKNPDAGKKKKKKLIRRKRNHEEELSDEQIQQRAAERKRKEKERNSKIKSQLYVTASDDESDDERDAAFFRLEEERRRRIGGVIRSQLLKEAGKAEEVEAGKKRKKGGEKGGSKRRKVDSDDDDDGFEGMDLDSDDDEVEDAATSKPTPVSSSEEEEEEEDDDPTPSTSPTALDPTPAPPLAEISNNPTKTPSATKAGDGEESEEDDEAPISKPVRASGVGSRRAGFILGDSDDDV